MGVLLRFGDAQLGQAQAADILAKNIGEFFAGVRHGDVGHGGVVLRHTHVDHGNEPPLALHVLEILVHEAAGDLSGPVGAEVVENDGVACLDLAPLGADHRLHELVGDPCVIGLLHGLGGVLLEGALAVGDGVVGPLHPVPALIPVHGVVPAHDRGDLAHAQLLALGLKLLYVPLAGAGGHVAAV